MKIITQRLFFKEVKADLDIPGCKDRDTAAIAFYQVGIRVYILLYIVKIKLMAQALERLRHFRAQVTTAAHINCQPDSHAIPMPSAGELISTVLRHLESQKGWAAITLHQ